MARWWSNSGREKRGEWAALPSVGVYTPNNRCRPEAPLTSLPKLTPVKNVEDRRVGEEEKEEQHKIKIIKDRSRGMVVKAGTQLNDVY